jgi:hypothetical protein
VRNALRAGIAATLPLLLTVLGGCRDARHLAPPADCPLVARAPVLSPDYAGVTLPPNLAPPSFVLREPGTAYSLSVHGPQGQPITLEGSAPEVSFPLEAWRALARANAGQALQLDVAVRSHDGQWRRYAPVALQIASEDIDGTLAYRLIKPLYNFWADVSVYQRDLTTYRQRTILNASRYAQSCTNCHCFTSGHTGRMCLGIRSSVTKSGTLLVDKGKVRKLDSTWAYPSWHPGGELAAYALIKVRQFFHSARGEVRDVVDLDSDVLVYDMRTQKSEAPPGAADRDRLESYPTWAPDGRALYFCSAPILWKDREAMPPAHWDQVRYDLRRISYDPATGAWGRVETVIAAKDAGASILAPRVSPDGRFLLYCQAEYGCFPIFQTSSDLWLLDLQTGARRPVREANSQWSESWHSWSSNGRWVAFSSKRMGGLFTRTFLSHVDAGGRFSKPVLLPQRDPRFYDGFLKTFSVPELAVEPVRISQAALAKAARSQSPEHVPQPDVSMTAKKKEAPASDPWEHQPRR